METTKSATADSMLRPAACIAGISYHLPELVITNEQLMFGLPLEESQRRFAKLGVQRRHIAGPDETSSDLAEAAAKKLFTETDTRPEAVDFILFCTQTPDFILPTSACLLQRRLGIPISAGALDVNLGSSGYVYCLSLAKGLVESTQAKCVLLLTGETYSKIVDSDDVTIKGIFGDGGTATLIKAEVHESAEMLGPFVFGTDGSGGEKLICRRGGFRSSKESQNGRTSLWMDGPAIFNLSQTAVPDAFNRILARSKLQVGDIDLFVFHQPNKIILEHFRRKLRIPESKFVVSLEQSGNTVSCTIPIALTTAIKAGRLKGGAKVMLIGFGVGFSWAAGMMKWKEY